MDAQAEGDGGSAPASANRPAYAPRNALNAGEIRRAIEARSAARGDAPEVRRWLLNHFYRHVVANFELATPLRSEAEARIALCGTLPSWVARRFGAGAAPQERAALMVWIDPTSAPLRALEARLVEFLTSRDGTALQGKLERINCPQALALWEREHARIAERIRRGWRQSNPQALREVCATPHGTLVELLPDSALLREEMAYESYRMGHCLGQFANRKALTGGYGGRYADAAQAGQLRLFSIRDERGEPHVTLSMLTDGAGRLTVEQVKGKQNRPPVQRYVEDVLAALAALDAAADDDLAPDCLALGLVRAGERWQPIESVTDAALLARLVSRHPGLYPRLTDPAPLVEWLVAARAPALLRERPPKSPALRYAAREIWRDEAATPAAAAAGQAPPTAMTEEVVWEGMPEAQWRALPRAPGWLWKMPGRMARAARAAWRWLRVPIVILLLYWLLGFWLLLFGVGLYSGFKKKPFPFLARPRHEGRKLWALALAAPMAGAIGQHGFYDRKAARVDDDWRQNIRPQFLHQLGLPASADDAAVARFLRESFEQRWYRADMPAPGRDADPRAALAFATARVAFFARNALLLGWLAPPLAWRVLLLNAQRAQECWAGWEDFGRACLAGRQQWILAGRADPMGAGFDEAALTRLLKQRQRKHGWKGLPWPGQAAFDPVAVKRGGAAAGRVELAEALAGRASDPQLHS